MSSLRAAVYIAPPTPFKTPGRESGGGLRSPISCTLVFSATEAVLVSYIYITRSHGDHFFGLPLLLQRFPEAKLVATAATVQHMKQWVEGKNCQAHWESRFPGEIARPFVLTQPLPGNNNSELQETWLFQAIDIGHLDAYDSTALWVPDLRLAVCGDVVYGQKIEALDPLYVVPDHCQEEVLGRWHLANTKKKNPKLPREIVETVTKLYRNRYNTGAPIMGAMGYS
ncbi:beta-lactamase-like protein [Aspergillus bertholletiae]|uniref:Beta-lactamase-like protein n=1 Tax=Aspergillus bertholletiae TaxID=1226010 RepID=A0A5N7BHA5_9EURO|nr:beta-lactamase-like protein [Aspergillus bertholletiae]